MVSVWTAELELTPPELLGLRLRPLCLGHLRALHAVRSPFLDKAHPPQVGDVALAVWICAQDPLEVTGEAMHNRLADFAAWGREVADLDIEAAANTLDQYLADWSTAPELWESLEERKSKRYGAPWWQRVHFVLVHYCHMTRTEAWCITLPEALRTYQVTGEMLGDAEIVEDGIEERIAAQRIYRRDPRVPLADQIAAIRAEEAANG